MAWRWFFVLLIWALNAGLIQCQTQELQVIQNEYIKIAVHPLGAELKSLTKVSDQKEYIWQGSNESWKKSSPILFPFIGKLWNDQYQYNAKTYPMGLHGFANQKTFEVVSKSRTELWFKLMNDAETLKIYPFEFELFIGYILEGYSCKVVYKVRNKGKNTMYFQIGGHPGFILHDITDMDTIRGYIKVFPEKNNKLHYIVKEDHAFFSEHPTHHSILRDDNGYIPLTKSLFKDDVVVFENHQISKIVVFDKTQRLQFSLETKMPNIALWTSRVFGAFVCIEPWWGRGDTYKFKGDVKDKKWMYSLMPKKSFTTSYRIKIIDIKK